MKNFFFKDYSEVFNKLFHPREKAEAKIVFETFDGEPINSKLLRIPLHETLFKYETILRMLQDYDFNEESNPALYQIAINQLSCP